MKQDLTFKQFFKCRIAEKKGFKERTARIEVNRLLGKDSF